jgi:hypothetical protein
MYIKSIMGSSSSKPHDMEDMPADYDSDDDHESDNDQSDDHESESNDDLSDDDHDVDSGDDDKNEIVMELQVPTLAMSVFMVAESFHFFLRTVRIMGATLVATVVGKVKGRIPVGSIRLPTKTTAIYDFGLDHNIVMVMTTRPQYHSMRIWVGEEGHGGSDRP